MPLEKLAGIKSIGTHYAKLIKNSVAEYDRVKHEKLPDQTAAAKEGKPRKSTRDLQKRVKRLHKNLNRVNENHKTLVAKKVSGIVY